MRDSCAIADGERLLNAADAAKAEIHPIRGPTCAEHVTLATGCYDGPMARNARHGNRIAVKAIPSLWLVLLALGCSVVVRGEQPVPVFTLSGHADAVYSVAFSPDGAVVASGSADKTIKLWNVSTGVEIRTLTGHSDVVYSVAFSPDGTAVASGSADDTVGIWDARAGTLIRTLSGHTSWVLSVAFSPDGKRLATGSDYDGVALWDLSTGKGNRVVSGYLSQSVAFSRDGRLAMALDAGARVWNDAAGQLGGYLATHPRYITSVTFSPNGLLLATGALDNSIKVWNSAPSSQPEKLCTLVGRGEGPVMAVAFSPDGQSLSSVSEDAAIDTWSVSTWQRTGGCTIDSGEATAAAFSPGGDLAAIGHADGTAILGDAVTGATLGTLDPLAGGSAILSLAFCPSGYLALAALGRVALWDGHTGTEELAIDLHVLLSPVAVSPDGRFLVSAGFEPRVWLWRLPVGFSSERWVLPTTLAMMPTAFAFSPDSALLAAGVIASLPPELGSDRYYCIQLWDVATKATAMVLRGHVGVVTSVVFSPTGESLASAAADDTVRLWAIATGEILATLPGGAATCIAFSPDARLLACGRPNGEVEIFVVGQP